MVVCMCSEFTYTTSKKMMTNKDNKFKALLSNYQDRIFRLCWTYAANEEDREDLYQNIILNIWKNMESFQNKSSVSTWIYRISVNTAIDFLRRHKKHKVLLSGNNAEISESIADPADIEESIERRERFRLLHSCIYRLSPVDKTIVTLYMEGMKYREIGEVIGISEKNVSVKLHRIKQVLNSFLKEYEL